MITIALDYDGTITADIDLWIDFIKKAHSRGHKVIVVTMRTDEESELIDSQIKALCEIHCTSRKAKKKFMRMKGINPNIWIDDNTDFLYEDSL